MRNIIYTLTILLLSINIYGQDNVKYQDTVFIKYNKNETGTNLKYVTDTIFFLNDMSRHILTGTTILPATHNQFTLNWEYGLYFNKIIKSEPQNNDQQIQAMFGYVKDEISLITENDTTLTIEIKIVDNCCYDFLCDISIVDKSIINLIYSGYGTHCGSDCIHILKYQLKKEKNINDKKIKSVMLNGYRKTIKNIK